MKPIKRCEELAPLSREHHEGLLFVWKIRQGIRKEISSERIISYCKWFWVSALENHFKQEEKLFAKVLHLNHPMLQQMFEEHRLLRDMFASVTSYSYAELETLASALNNHIRFEERQLFNEVEKLAVPEDLHAIQESLQQEKACAVWKDEFWLND